MRRLSTPGLGHRRGEGAQTRIDGLGGVQLKRLNKGLIWRSLLAVLALSALHAAACAGDDPEPAAQPAGTTAQPAPSDVQKLSVITTTNFAADWARIVGGDRVEVFSLLPTGGDPHSWQPGAADVARLAKADLVLSIGLGLEGGWLDELIDNASAEETAMATLGDAIDPIEFAVTGHGDEEEEEEDDHGPLDPHFWFDPMRVKLAVNDIAEQLALLDPGSADTFRANARAYGAELDAVHAWAEQQLSAIPEERRVLVTSHDSFTYFAVVYGFEVVGTVLPGGTTEVDPSARDVAELIGVIEEHGVGAVFGETTVSDRVAKSISQETGVEFVALHSGSLGAEGSGADTYLGMFRQNIEAIANALK